MKTNSNIPKTVISTVLFSCILFLNTIFSQDIIIKKNNEQIKAKIMEIGTTEIKFKYFEAQQDSILTINKSDVKTLKIKGVYKDKIIDLTDSQTRVSDNKTNTVKSEHASSVHKPGLCSTKRNQKHRSHQRGLQLQGNGILNALYWVLIFL